MADGYWNRQQPLHPSGGMLKRPRTDYDPPPSGVRSAQQMHNYLAREDDRTGMMVVKATKTIESAYDHYLQNMQLTSFASGEASSYNRGGLGKSSGGGVPSLPLADSVSIGRSGAPVSELASKARGVGFDAPDERGRVLDAWIPVDVPNSHGVGFDSRLPADAMPRPARDTLSLPPGASNTLYVEGLPPDSTRREVCHIFRPFVGYKEVRLVKKESKHRGGDPLILCFVDFTDSACAATALSALQGYEMDEDDPDSPSLRLQFSKHPGPRSGSRFRGKR